MQQVETLILGAGPTGLGAAWRLNELGNTDWVLLESAATPGGMASSEKDPAGFIWDLGGHVIHSHFPYFDAVLNTVREWQHPRRSGWIWLGGTFVPTPIQRHLGALPDERGSAVVAELAALSNQPANNLYDYFVATFGPTLTNVFFSPFNDKMWAHSAKLIDHAWTSLRSGSGAANIPAPAPTLISENRPDDTSQFPYPRFGTGAMWAEIAARIPAERQRYRTTVAHVDLERRVAHTTSGEEFAFDQCISSIPLRRLLDSMVDDSHLQARAGDLLHSSVHAVGFGYEGKIPPQLVGVSWIYSPEPGTPVLPQHRALQLLPGHRGTGPLVDPARGRDLRPPPRRHDDGGHPLSGGDEGLGRSGRPRQRLAPLSAVRLPGAIPPSGRVTPSDPLPARGPRRALTGTVRRLALRVVQPGPRLHAGRGSCRRQHDRLPGAYLLG